MLRISNRLFLLICACIFAYSCNSDKVYDVYKSTPNQWHKDSIVSFNFKAPDTLHNYNLYVNLRNNNAYAYNNLFLLVQLDYPNGKSVVDTLEYKMAAPNGELLGTGFTNIKENKLWYKGYNSQFKFAEIGDYKVNIQHAMRKNGNVDGVINLEGITDIGFSIENRN